MRLRLNNLKIRKRFCEDCKSAAGRPSCASCSMPLVAKRIPSFAASLIEINEDMISLLLQKGLSDTSVVYHQCEKDKDGHILIMDCHPTTLRHVINSGRELTEHDWMVIMLAICTRLQNASAHGLHHGDLKPSNGMREIYCSVF